MSKFCSTDFRKAKQVANEEDILEDQIEILTGQEGHDVLEYFEGESIIPGANGRANESVIVEEDNLLQLLDQDTKNMNSIKKSRSRAKKEISKDPSNTKKSLSKSKNRQAKEAYVMKNTFEDLSNRIRANSIINLPTQNSSRLDSMCHSTIKSTVHFNPSLGQLQEIDTTQISNFESVKTSQMKNTTLEQVFRNQGNSHHLSKNYQSENPKSIFSKPALNREHILPKTPEKTTNFLPMESDVAHIRKSQEIEKAIAGYGESQAKRPKNLILRIERGPIKVIKNFEVQESSDRPSKNVSKTTNVSPAKIRRRSQASIKPEASKDHTARSSVKSQSSRTLSGTKGIMEQSAGGGKRHHFKTIQDVLQSSNITLK